MCRMTEPAAQEFVTAAGKHELKQESNKMDKSTEAG